MLTSSTISQQSPQPTYFHNSNSSINHRETERPTQALKTVNKIWGAILAFFGAALKVEGPSGKIVYITMTELKSKLLLNNMQGLSKSRAEQAKNDKIANNLFFSIINPMKGTTVSWQTLTKFKQKAFEANLSYNSSDPKPLYASLRKIRAAMYNQQALTTDQKKFIGNIKVGDVIFHRTDDTVHSDIVQFQHFASAIGLGPKHRDGVNHNHVYICAKVDKYGKKWFAEAAWPSGKEDEIRLISEDDMERCFLKQNKGALSEIFRCTNPELAKAAAKQARVITTKLTPQENGSAEKQPTKLRYSIGDGAQALFFSNKFGHGAKVRLFEQILSRNEEGIPTEFIKQPKALFCSSLVGYAYQMAEARPIVKEILQRDQQGDQKTLKKPFQAHTMAFKHGKELDDKMLFKIDPKLSTPADLYSWMTEHQELFTAVQSYQQPNDEPTA